MGKGWSERNHPTDDLTRSAISSGGGWIYVLKGRFQVKEDHVTTWVGQGESFLFTNPTHAVPGLSGTHGAAECRALWWKNPPVFLSD